MIFEKIKTDIKHILTKKPKILLGLSGGPDSVFLFHFLKKLHKENKIELIAAHLDHGWRKESANDANFCANLCNEYETPLFTAHANNLVSDFKFNGSKEELGRKLRRTFLENTAKEQNADFIALAHHLQDQQETFFWRIIRGSTLSGLTCMKQLDNQYLRPLLNISKTEILNYLDQNKIEYLIDKTNTSDNYLRNRIRKYVLPAMQKCDERFDQKFESSLKHLQEEETFLKRITQQIFEQVFKQNKTLGFVGNLKTFQELDIVLQKRTIMFWLITENICFSPSESYLNEILRFLSTENGGNHQLGQSWRLCKKKKHFWIEQE